MKTDYFKLVVSIGVSVLAGLIGGFFTSPAIPTWYAGLVKPWFTPPSWVFAPVWTVLYVLMGIALYLVWVNAKKKKEARRALPVFGAQLVLNALWSLAFFGWRTPFYGLVVIALLWMVLAFTLALFWRVDKRAGWLLVPYLVWTTFAAFLNLSIWQLN
ncbi:tryptophan-rich sensory protein [Candidatus Micrarchaeota archaeon]|nr:tryptophan-rich sensory protein [Candidatus Micrarchaeota archaeon]